MRDITERLLDIQDAIVKIMKYTRDGRDRFDHDELVQTWVTYNLYIIGEATRAIANEFPDFKTSIQKYTGVKLLVCARYSRTDISTPIQTCYGQRSHKTCTNS